jgi:Xaa-Pro dipeptidase
LISVYQLRINYVLSSRVTKQCSKSIHLFLATVKVIDIGDLHSFLQTVKDGMSFWRGNQTLKVSNALFGENRQRLVKALQAKGLPKGSVVVLEGGKERTRYNTDAEELAFRQESYFFWTFGVHEADCYGLLNVESGKSVLFPPKLHPDYAIWEGQIRPEKYFLDKYGVDEVVFNEKAEIRDHLKKDGVQKLYLLVSHFHLRI